MYSYVKESERELSVRKQNELHNYMRIVNWGRQNPVRFAEEIFGTQLIDFQRWVFAESWWRPFVLWLVCRGGSKDTLSAIIDMTKMMLIPNYKIFISCQTAAQAAESFKKLEDIAKQRLPSFKSLTDIFSTPPPCQSSPREAPHLCGRNVRRQLSVCRWAFSDPAS